MRALRFACWFAVAAVSTAAADVPWREINRQPAAWYAGEEAAAIARSIVQYQKAHGGWSKNTDMTRPPTETYLASTLSEDVHETIDNGATTTQLTYLARVVAATDDPMAKATFFRGLDYLLAAQYANGGWPQFYPLRAGYYSHITFNDDAMIHVMVLLRDAAAGQGVYAFVDESRRERCRIAVAKGIDCILRSQIEIAGAKTAWCAQHDEHTLAPAPARKFEPVSLSGQESAGIVRFLMEIDQPSPEVVAAVQASVRWFEQVKITGLRVDDIAAPSFNGGKDKVVVQDPQAPVLWARFYEPGTNRPIFIGRDAVIRYAMAEIEHERRVGYRWYTQEPAKILKTYAKWSDRWVKHRP